MEEKRYEEIFSKIKDYLPKEWTKTALYFLFSGNMISHEFYVDSGNGFVSCFNMGYDDSTINNIFDSIENILINEREKLPPKKAWSVFTMFIDKSGKFDIKYDYGNMLNKFIKYQKKWEDKYIYGPKGKNKI